MELILALVDVLIPTYRRKSGIYHLGLPTTVEDRSHNATELFEELIREFNVNPPRDKVFGR